MKFKELIKKIDLHEGVYDKGIFKAFFLAGGPGSGKTFVTAQAFAGTGLRVINSDRAFENAMKKAGLSLKMPDSEQEVRDMVRARAKATTQKMLDLSLDGRLGIIIDGTADKLENGTVSSLLATLGVTSADRKIVGTFTSANASPLATALTLSASLGSESVSVS